jgi:hypothetical protein
VQPEEEWTLFRHFDEPGAAEGLCLWLRNEQIAARVEGAAVFVHRSQRHRAGWILDHLPPSDDDLRTLAAGNT